MLKDYLRSAFHNRITLSGYIAGVASIPLMCSDQYNDIGSALLMIGFIGLFSTSAGQSTQQAYYRTQDHIDRYGTIDRRFAKAMRGWYCDEVGLKMAAKERGLEHLLK